MCKTQLTATSTVLYQDMMLVLIIYLYPQIDSKKGETVMPHHSLTLVMMRIVNLLALLQAASAQLTFNTGCTVAGKSSFSQDLVAPTSASIVAGSIQKGAWDVMILLESTVDIDVQLFDRGDATCPSGAAIVGFSSSTSPCSRGM